jgi:hypothetical protein
MLLYFSLPIRNADNEIIYGSFFAEAENLPTKDELIFAAKKKQREDAFQFENYSQIKEINKQNEDFIHCFETMDKELNPMRGCIIGQSFQCETKDFGKLSGFVSIIEPIKIGGKAA